jgi:hypothetical protein
MNPLTKKFPDTVQGAKDCLRELADATTYSNMVVLTWTPDPVVAGVWGVIDNGKVRCIVYLAGYSDPFGNVRAMNDFEAD